MSDINLDRLLEHRKVIRLGHVRIYRSFFPALGLKRLFGFYYLSVGTVRIKWRA